MEIKNPDTKDRYKKKKVKTQSHQGIKEAFSAHGNENLLKLYKLRVERLVLFQPFYHQKNHYFF